MIWRVGAFPTSTRFLKATYDAMDPLPLGAGEGTRKGRGTLVACMIPGGLEHGIFLVEARRSNVIVDNIYSHGSRIICRRLKCSIQGEKGLT